ncbi:hypothetical protein EV424DRAFT_1470932 [Suillus variegatus]|nr:hypothetical protein EV424DRAFT_1470932 [Suillus variegatus]
MPNCSRIPAASPSNDTQHISLSEIELINLFSQKCSLLQSQPFHMYPNETLIYHGYIGCAPVYPTVAISFYTLAAYHQICCVCPSFGFQWQCKVLCFLHNHLQVALKHDNLNWCLLNLCPACFQTLKDEPALKFEWLPCTDFWIDPESVNRSSSDVRIQAVSVGQLHDHVLIIKTNPAPFSCADWWKNASPKTCKQMFSVFDKLRIFIAMAKYPLAIIEKLLTVYDKDNACAYDIGCAFMKTLGNSALRS